MSKPKNSSAKMPNSGFVAGTLIHTQTGLKPIEQIKVGDYVLSKPESGVGEPSYKRVSRTFEYDDKEVWYVLYDILTEDYMLTHESSFFIATGEHLVRVKGHTEYKDYSKRYELQELNIWEPVRELITNSFHAYGGNSVMIELRDGCLVNVDNLYSGGLLMRSNSPDSGIVAAEFAFLQPSFPNTVIFFDEGQPEELRGDFDFFDEELDSRNFPEDSIGHRYGFPPLLRKVYNLEVEENHTYFVGKLGMWVHDAIQQTS